MYKPMTLLALLLAGFLTACGGSDGGSVVQGGDGTSGGDTGDNSGVDDVTTGTNIANPRLGTGAGADFALGQLDVSVSDLSAGGTTQISAFIVDSDSNNAKIVSKQYGVSFSSGCSSAVPPKATFSKSEVVTGSGEVSVTYEAKGCAGTDVVSFTLYDAEEGVIQTDTVLHAATAAITVQPPEVGAITYSSTTAPAISINRIGDPVLPKLTTVSFVVLDQTNNPIEGKTVNFSLTSETGGVRLAIDSAVTDEEGVAKAIVQAGSVHTTTSVRASTLANDGVTVIQTSSQPISVTTGIADQDSFDIVADVLNPAAYDEAGVEVKVTAFVGDQYQNPVANGTIVNFTAESGLIESQCTTTDGSCFVTWKSTGYRPGQERWSDYEGLNRVNERDPRRSGYGDPYSSGRPCDNDNDCGTVYGLTTIMAYTQGTAGFTDSNSNGLFDSGEPFESFSEAIRDDDVVNSFRAIQSLSGAEQVTSDYDFVDGVAVEFNADFDSDGVRDPAPSTYQGVLCSDDALALGQCASLMYVRDSLVISQSHSSSNRARVLQWVADSSLPEGGRYEPFDRSLPTVEGESIGVYVYVTDVNGSFPAAGTTLNASGDGYKVKGAGPVGEAWGIQEATTVFNETAEGNELPGTARLANGESVLNSSFGFRYLLEIEAESDPKSVEISITAADGTEERIRTLRP